MDLSFLNKDLTLVTADHALIEEAAKMEPRSYLGASSIGENCNRKIWYRFRWLREKFDADTLKRFEDGHRTEDLVIQRLKLNINVSIVNETEQHQQIGFKDIDGHFSGHIDGLITGVHAAPKTTHVLEIKCVSDKKFVELQKAKAELGEKQAIRKWNPVYYAQIVVYMQYMKLKRAYHVIATAGGRAWDSCRTEEDAPFALSLIEKARNIIYANDTPQRLSNDKSYYECKFCSFYKVCHEKELPNRHCRTCLHSSPAADGKWTCHLYGEIDYEKQLAGCPSHAYIPSFVDGEIKEVVGNRIVYTLKDGSEWSDGK